MTVNIGGTEYTAAELVQIIAESDNEVVSNTVAEIQTLVEGLHDKSDDIKTVVDGIEFHDTDMSEVVGLLNTVLNRLDLIETHLDLLEGRLPNSWTFN